MSISIYSVVMALIWFTLAVLIGHCVLRRAEKCGLAFIGMIFFMTLLRIFMPLDLEISFVICSQVVYPALRDFMNYSLLTTFTVGRCILLIWAAGSVFRLSQMARDLMQRQTFWRKVTSLEGDNWPYPLFLKAAAEVDYRGPAKVALAENTSSAYQAGFIHPNILLPKEIDTFSDGDICNMFRHELCHFLNGDLWIKTGCQVMTCILWWNPVMTMLSRSVEQLLELHCDQKVCRRLSAENQISYLETLVRLAKHGSRGVLHVYMGYLGQDNNENMTQRFRMILLCKPNTFERCKQVVSCALCFSLFIASYCVILQPWGKPPEMNKDEPVIFELTSDDAYIVFESDGTLKLYSNGIDCGIIQEKSLTIAPFNQMPIIYEEKG